MSIAYDMLKYLESKGIGTENVDLFINFEQEDPNNLIVFFDESAPGLSESSCLNIDLQGLQIIVRNENVFTAESKLKNIHKKIVGFGGESLVSGGDVISYIIVETSPFSLGKDDKGRNKWTAHYNVRYQTENDDFRL